MSELLCLSDDFSSGDFSKWSGVTKSDGENAYVDKTQSDYFARFTSDSSLTLYSPEHYSYAYKVLRSSTETVKIMRAKASFRIASSGMVEHGDRLDLIQIRNLSGEILASAGLFLAGTKMVWHLYVNTVGGPVPSRYDKFTEPHDMSNPKLNTWYDVKFLWEGHELNGVASLAVDRRRRLSAGPPRLSLIGARLSVEGVNTASSGTATDVRFGLPSIIRCNKPSVDLDNVDVWIRK